MRARQTLSGTLRLAELRNSREGAESDGASSRLLVYISGASNGSSSSGAKAPLTSRAIFKPGIESNAPRARMYARTHAIASRERKRARERSETDAMRRTVPYSRRCPYNVPLSQFPFSFLYTLRRESARQSAFADDRILLSSKFKGRFFNNNLIQIKV